MRIMLDVVMDTVTTNRMVADGTMGPTIEEVLGKLQPEVCYAYARNGARALTLVVDAPDGATLPSLAEPFWLRFNATVDATPVMAADELGQGLARLG